MKPEQAPEKKRECSDQERVFCEEYIKTFRKDKAAIAAGYSKHSAPCIGHEVYHRPQVRERIAQLLNDRSITAEETQQIISDMAKDNLADYFKTTKVMKTPKVRKSLKLIIAEKQEFIRRENIFAERKGWKGKALKLHQKNMQAHEDEIIRLEIELESNPAAFRIVDGVSVLVEEQTLDIDKIIKNKGRIKSVKHTKDGMQVEMYSALDASVNIAKIHGLFEKDNNQKNKIILSDEPVSFE